MKVNPNSPDFQQQIESTASASRTGKEFAQTLTSKSQPADSAAPAVSVQALSQQDLADPIKADVALNRAVQELIEKEFGGMCNQDREQVAAWLRSDPMMRAALLSRLTS